MAIIELSFILLCYKPPDILTLIFSAKMLGKQSSVVVVNTSHYLTHQKMLNATKPFSAIIKLFCFR